MSHGSELPKVTSVYLETAEPIDWNSTMKVCAMKDDFASHRIYIVQAVAAWGNFAAVTVGGEEKWGGFLSKTELGCGGNKLYGF